MVKADPKHDYYADLELPSTADSDTIKKQFRLLAKQYHPDRNPGKEIEVIPKFQAIQAAHEILGDATQKKRYDIDRANITKSQDGPDIPVFKKPPKPPPGTSQFPPPPKRNPNPPPRSQFGAGIPRPNSSASAERFASFTRNAPPQWDRQKFEEAAREEALRNLNNMRPQSQGPPPRVPPRAAPTAPRPPSTGASPDLNHGSAPSPGFPGLSRTNSARRGGFTPGTPGADEPPAPSSAYAYVHRSDRPVPPPPTAASYVYQSYGKGGLSSSPPAQRSRPSMSPLRQSKSSGFDNADRPGLQRTPSRYKGYGGERIDVNSPGLKRSTSVRNSPVDDRWDEAGPFGRSHQPPPPPQPQPQPGFKSPPPRHHSSSPRGRAGAAPGFRPSSSETSSSEDDEPVPRMDNRPKATPRRPQAPLSTHSRHPEKDPLTAQFPSNNYNTKITDDKQYYYPPPEANGNAHRRDPNNVPESVDDITQGMKSSGVRHVHRDDVLNKKYEIPSPHPVPTQAQPWISPLGVHRPQSRDHTIRGIPAWALPSSIYPSRTSKRTNTRTPNRPTQNPHKIGIDSASHSPAHVAAILQDTDASNSQSSHHTYGASSEAQSGTPNTNATFSAADWDGKFAESDNPFRPSEPNSRSRSPTKQPRPKPPNRNKGNTRSQEERDGVAGNFSEAATAKMPGVRHVAGVAEGLGKAAAFQPGSFSAEDWGQKLRSQSNSNPLKATPRDNSATPSLSTKQPEAQPEISTSETPSSPLKQSHPVDPDAGPDAMEVDEQMPHTTNMPGRASAGRSMSDTTFHRPSSSSGGVNLNDLKETAPFKPTSGGLSDLGDLNDTLPFESRAAEELNLKQAPSHGQAARHLNLPTPPKPVSAPDGEHLTQESWSVYSHKMSLYMEQWNIFNCKMIDHFRLRQEQISLAMYHNWVTAVGDGASADDFDGLDFVGSDPNSLEQANGHGAPRVKPKKAGYATYMQWLEQDHVCRTWWDVAFDEHTACMKDLGRVRRLVKSIRAQEYGKGA